jgi:hypothetical protein
MRFLVIAAALVIIISGINQAQSVVALFLVSFFLAVIGTVPVLWMERKRIPSVAAVLIVVAAQGKKMLEWFQQKHGKPRNYLSVNDTMMKGRNIEIFEDLCPARSIEYGCMDTTTRSICAAGICEFSTFL